MPKPSSIVVFQLSKLDGGRQALRHCEDITELHCLVSYMQNDLQAMARCHRIGQDKEVRVYRLITSGTYEQNVFECSTRKQGALHALIPPRPEEALYNIDGPALLSVR